MTDLTSSDLVGSYSVQLKLTAVIEGNELTKTYSIQINIEDEDDSDEQLNETDEDGSEESGDGGSDTAPSETAS